MPESTEKDAALSAKMREMAEQSVEQAKQAYERYVSSTERMFNTMEDATRQAWSGAREVNLRMATFADENAKAGFDYAEQFVKAPGPKEAAEIQQSYLKQSTERLTRQMKELNELTTRAARETVEATKPKS